MPASRPRLVAYTDNDLIGGAEAVLATLLEALGERVEPVLLGTHRPVLEWIAERCDVPVVLVEPVVNKRDLRAIRRHVGALRALRPDVLHVNLRHPFSGQYAIAAARLLGSIHVVAVEHAVWPPSNARQRRLRWGLMRHGVHAHVAVGERTARAIERLIGLPTGRIQTIYNGVADVPVEPLPRLREEPTIGFVGRLADEKGADVLLSALPEVPGAAAVLVGDGPERAALGALAAELGVGERVVLCGWREDARRLLAGFDVLAVPSRREGFGLAVVEAMLAQRPVIAAAVGGLPEVVAGGETGLLVAPEDPVALAAALRELLADGERRAAMGRAARERALASFSAAAMADAFAELYERLLAPSRHAPGRG